MNRLTEAVFGLAGVAAIGIAIYLAFTEGAVDGFVFLVFSILFIGGVATIVEKVDIVLDKIFTPRR